ncbi:MAG: PAS domain S-box protein [Caldimonas sp.]
MENSPPSKPPAIEESRYRFLVEAVTDYAIYMLDANGVVDSWNPGAERIKGYSAAEIIGQHFSQFYPPEDRQAGRPAIALATAAREGKFEGEGWRLRKDGSRFWAHVIIDPIRDAAGGLIGFAKVTRDLTERRQAEETLRRSQEQFRLLVQGVTDYAIYMLDTEGRVSSWNAGAQRIKGYAEGEVLGRHFSHFYRPEEQRRGEPLRALATAVKEGRYESEGWRVRKDGRHFWANVVIDPIRDASGQLIGFAKVTRDVSERRATQHALERARESLFQSQKLDAIGQLTGGVAHDFNNLLMVIVSSLELVRRRTGTDPKTVQLLENAMQAALRGASLTQRMLAFARRQELKPTAVDIHALVVGMFDLLQRSLGPTVAIQLQLPAGLPRVRVDPNQLELALLNLTVNARDALADGGTITIEAEPETHGAVGRLSAGTYVRLKVIDTGSGMDEATLARATEPFFTTKGVGKGTGLGLSMVDGLASQSGGQFVLSSTPGVGTTAELWLPATETMPASEPDSRAPSTATSAPRLVVLVVDDDSLVLSSTMAMLEELGHTVLGASSAAEALQILLGGDTVQLLVTDQAMPQMTGAQLIGRLHDERPALPVILATGYAEIGIELPNSVVRLTKPFGQQALAQAIAASIRGD